ncbi:MAG: efflux transporter outer membrane subunit [Proteobacteria bacterium]|nr:efflux transporter outer membrane subunit [Pseudomonadota bacterium]
MNRQLNQKIGRRIQQGGPFLKGIQSCLALSRIAIVTMLGLGVSSCAVGPSYQRPEVEVPSHFQDKSGWVQSAPARVVVYGPWWTVFQNSTLNRLEPEVAKANQSLRAAYYAYVQANALTRLAQAQYYPTVGSSLALSRSNQAGSTASGSNGLQSGPSNEASLGLSASWEPDLWGKIRDSVRAARAGAEASRGDLLAAQLSLQGTLAQTYFQFLLVGEEIQLARKTVASYRATLRLTRNRYHSGVVTRADVAQAKTQLDNARVQLASLGVQRSQLEHAIAVLIGQPPSLFHLTDKPSRLPAAPLIPAGVPSQILLRRPDLFAAQRRVAQANAQVGVARSAFFPALTLSAQSGWRSSVVSDLFKAPSLFWSLGPSLAETLLDGGARKAQVLETRAAYQEAVAQYRQDWLQALQQAEDNLSALAILQHELYLQQQAVSAALDSLHLTLNQYRAGTLPYLNVLTAQTSVYTARNALLQIEGEQLSATVALIQALGGGWGEDNGAKLGPRVLP